MDFDKILWRSKEFGAITFYRVQEESSHERRVWTTSGEMGEILMSEIFDENFRVWHMKFIIARHVTILMEPFPPVSFIGLSFSLKKNVAYEVKGLGPSVTRRNHYNFTWVQESNVEFRLKKGDYELFGIEFTTDYFKTLRPEGAPLFHTFVTSVLEGQPSAVMKGHHAATSQIMDIVNDLIRFPYPGTLPDLFMKSKVADLLRLSVENMATDREGAPALSSQDIKLLHQAKEYLLANLDNPGSLSEIAMRTGINEFKLKNGFRQEFGTTVMAFVHDERLKRAKTLITETALPMKVIAIRAGYRSLPNFTTAFRKRFGYPPGSLRRGPLDDLS